MIKFVFRFQFILLAILSIVIKYYKQKLLIPEIVKIGIGIVNQKNHIYMKCWYIYNRSLVECANHNCWL